MNFVHFIFNHHSKILKLNKSFKQSSRFCPKKTDNTYFWNPTWKSYNFQTIGPNDPKIKPQLDHTVYDNFDLDKSKTKLSTSKGYITLLLSRQLLTL